MDNHDDIGVRMRLVNGPSYSVYVREVAHAAAKTQFWCHHDTPAKSVRGVRYCKTPPHVVRKFSKKKPFVRVETD